MECPACQSIATADLDCDRCGGLGRVGSRPYERQMPAPKIDPDRVALLRSRHPTPWTIEEDWTYEVRDAAGALVAKCMTAVEAMLLIRTSGEAIQ